MEVSGRLHGLPFRFSAGVELGSRKGSDLAVIRAVSQGLAGGCGCGQVVKDLMLSCR